MRQFSLFSFLLISLGESEIVLISTAERLSKAFPDFQLNVKILTNRNGEILDEYDQMIGSGQ